jgi:uncharacterized protein (DUF58 family)
MPVASRGGSPDTVFFFDAGGAKNVLGELSLDSEFNGKVNQLDPKPCKPAGPLPHLVRLVQGNANFHFGLLRRPAAYIWPVPNTIVSCVCTSERFHFAVFIRPPSGSSQPFPAAWHTISSGMAVTDLQYEGARKFPAFVRERWTRVDRAAWRRFVLALLALTLSLFVALYATSLRESGRYVLAAALAFVSLALAGLVAVKVVPYLARRTAIERWMTKVEYEFTREGALYLAIVGVIAVAALNTGNNLLFMVLSCLLAGILASGIISMIVLDGLALEIVLPEHVFAEQPAIAGLHLANGKHFSPSFSLTVSAPTARPGWRRRPVPVPYPAILKQAVYIPHIPRHSAVSRNVELTFPRRGRYSQDALRISTKFPFGFLRKMRTVPGRQEVLVLPKVEPTEEFYEILPLIGSETESYLKGRGHDLYGIRDYQQTDTARHVDWKATAKSQQLKVREFTREDERRLGLVFDPRLPNGDPQTLGQFEKAVTFCACLAWHFYEIGAIMQFITEGFETFMAPAAENIYPILEKLALIAPLQGDAPRIESLFAQAPTAVEGFRIILTHQSRGSIPTRQWASSYFVFMDSL